MKVLYFSDQLKKFIPAEVMRVMRSASGEPWRSLKSTCRLQKRYYDLTIKKSVPEARIRAMPAADLDFFAPSKAFSEAPRKGASKAKARAPKLRVPLGPIGARPRRRRARRRGEDLSGSTGRGTGETSGPGGRGLRRRHPSLTLARPWCRPGRRRPEGKRPRGERGRAQACFGGGGEPAAEAH